MIIRFLDGKENCYQVDTLKTPMLIYLETDAEIDHLHKIQKGDCLIMVPTSVDEATANRLKDKLNMKEEPKNLR